MASSGNFCTMNQIDTGVYQTVTEGNLKVGGTGSSTADQAKRGATFYVNSGKWYWEVRQTVGGTSYGEVGISVGSAGTGTPSANSGFSDGLMYQSIAGTLAATAAGYVGLGTVTTTSTGVSAISSNQVINIALDMDNRKLWFGKDGTYFNSGDPANGTNPQFSWTTDTFVTPTSKNYATNRPSHYNFGQDSTFGGNETAGGNADGNSHGDFHSSVPTGFLALCSSNLPISDDIDPAQTDDDYVGGKQFGVVTYTGNGSTQSITGLGFQPDLVWLKRRDGAKSHALFDSSRGVTKYISADNANNEATDTSTLTAFGSDGFSLASPAANNLVNGNGFTYVGWAWRVNAGTTASNSNGDISSTVQVNDKAGFSIVKYTGDLSSSGNRTVGHGLSTAPDLIIRRGLNVGERWAISHVGCTSFNYMMELNSTNAEVDKSGNGSMSAPTTTVFSNNYTDGYAVNGTNYVAYCFHSVDGFSKFGSYVGNGDANGPFVYTGFRPRFLIIKARDSGQTWFMYDTARSTFNPVNRYLYGQRDLAEDTAGSIDIDFLSNGFKIKNSRSDTNTSGDTYLYISFADVPFKYNNTF